MFVTNLKSPNIMLHNEMTELDVTLPLGRLHQNQTKALTSAKEFSQTTEQLGAAMNKLENVCREYLNELKRLDTRPLHRKSLRLAQLADSWAGQNT